MRQLYYSDMDGTLLGRGGKASKETLETLKKLLQEGADISLATGRSLPNIKHILGDLPLKLPVIESNGAFLTDYRSGERLVSNYFPQELVDPVLDFLMNFKESITIGTFDGTKEKLYVWNKHINFGMFFYILYLKQHGADHVLKMIELKNIPKDIILNIQLVARESRVRKILEWAGQFEDRLFVHAMSGYGGWWYISFGHRNSTKEEGLKAIRRMYPDSFITVFGDNVNDLDLFRAADHKVAVENAISELKDQADEIIGTNVQNSVIRYIERKYHGTQR